LGSQPFVQECILFGGCSRAFTISPEKKGRKFQLISPAEGNFAKVIMRGRNGNDEGYPFIFGKNPTWFLFLGVRGASSVHYMTLISVHRRIATYIFYSLLTETLLPSANEPLSESCQGDGCFWILSAAQRSTSHSPIRNKLWVAGFWAMS
jgi:hypothetical protein